MSNILPKWFIESTDRVMATDGLIARGAEDEEEEDKKDNDNSEDEGDGYSE